MNTKNLLASLAIVSSVLFSGCEKDSTNPDNPIAIPDQKVEQSAVNLRSAGDYVLLAGSGISNVPTSKITGNIGLSPAAGTFLTGFSLILKTDGISSTSSQVTGSLFASNYTVPTPANLTAAKGDLTTAYNDAAGRTSTDIVLLAGNIGGLTLTPGLYKSSGSLEISSGDLTFDAKGNSDAVFIIQIASTLLTTSGREIVLSGRATAANIFWQVGTSATIGTTSKFKGNIMADQSISLNTGASVDGRLLARIGEITLEGNTIVKK
ncbi:MAG: DUF3494 domain-containing protein [Bacteroidetes bacterium]|nr:DUF3494 domain-containing protein [Bacteroidota bacterium]